MSVQKISEMPPVETLAGTELIPCVKDGFNRTITPEQISASSKGVPYKSYVALLTQSNSDNPVASVLYNDLGVELSWTRVSQYGQIVFESYKPEIMLTGKMSAFATNSNSGSNNSTHCSVGIRGASSAVLISVKSPANVYMDNFTCFIEIRIYP